MFPKYTNCNRLIEFTKENELYALLLSQLEKDFNRTGINIILSDTINTKKLINFLENTLKDLIHTNFNTFTNLLYIIDIKESQSKNTQELNLKEYTEYITILILNRTLQKVWYKIKFSN